MSSDATFAIAQALRQSHCDRKGQEHECVGSVSIERGKVNLSCALCGKGESIPGWSTYTAVKLSLIFRAAGISWENLTLDAQVSAIAAYHTSCRQEGAT